MNSLRHYALSSYCAAANHTQQVDAENHVAERDSAQLHSQKENKLPTSQEPAVTTVTKKRKRDVIKQSIQEKAQAVEESKAKKTAEPAKQARKKKPEKFVTPPDVFYDSACSLTAPTCFCRQISAADDSKSAHVRLLSCFLAFTAHPC